jgi:hypothetical protein
VCLFTITAPSIEEKVIEMSDTKMCWVRSTEFNECVLKVLHKYKWYQVKAQVEFRKGLSEKGIFQQVKNLKVFCLIILRIFIHHIINMPKVKNIVGEKMYNKKIRDPYNNLVTV